MCTNPLTIRNNSKRFATYTHRLENIIPCGKCHECREADQKQWSIRAEYELYNTNIIYNGCTAFITLTFSEDHVPSVDLADRSILTFDHSLLKGFLKRLRTCLDRGCYLPIGGKSNRTFWFKASDRRFPPASNHKHPQVFRYLVTSEYGKPPRKLQNGKVTKGFRPHYHVLLHFPFKLPLYNLKRLLDKCWPYGRISGSKKGFFISGPEAAHYVCKYISKDLNLDFHFDPGYPEQFQVLKQEYGHLCEFSSSDMSPLLYWCHKWPDSNLPSCRDEAFVSDVIYKRELRSLLKDIRPRHFQSISYGISLLDQLSESDKRTLMIDGLIPTKTKKGIKYIKAPRYYMRKVFYTLVNNSYIPNHYGQRYLKHSYHRSLQSLESSYLSVLHSDFDDVDTVVTITGTSSRVILKRIKETINQYRITPRKLAEYSLVYRGYSFISDFHNQVTQSFYQLPLDFLDPYKLFCKRVSCLDFDFPSRWKEDIQYHEIFDLLRRHSYNMLGCFIGYDYVLDNLSILSKRLSEYEREKDKRRVVIESNSVQFHENPETVQYVPSYDDQRGDHYP